MMPRRKIRARVLVLSWAIVLGGGWVGRAEVVEVKPAFQIIAGGSIASVDLLVSGLSAGTAPSIGGFDLTIFFDPSILSFQDVQFGTALGDPILDAVSFSSLLGPGQVEIFEVSLLDPFILDSSQPDTFVLATLSFQGVGIGISPMDFDSFTLSDANANPVAANTVGGAIQVVPEPGYWPAAFSLGALAFCIDFGRRRRQGRRLR